MPQNTSTQSPFALPERLRAKATPRLIGPDEAQFREIRAALDAEITDVGARLDAARRRRSDTGQSAVEREDDVRRLTARLRLMQRFGPDACLGSMTTVGGDRTYIGRFGLSTPTGERLLVDWRAPAAEPFFAATHANPGGLAARRRYRWAGRRVVDYWDEVFADDGIDHSPALDDQSAFVASLAASRSSRMRDVLATIHADQDAIIRAGSQPALVVDGGPGTGKTVVALHRVAYLLYSEPRLRERGGVLLVGPHRPYLAYIDDVLPSLGEEGALTCTLQDLVPGAADAVPESDPRVVRLKGDLRLADAVDAAVRVWERLPTRAIALDTPWGDLPIGPSDWALAFDGADTQSHNLAREQAWPILVAELAARVPAARDESDHPDHRWSEGWGDEGSWDGPGGVEEEGGFDAYGVAESEGSAAEILDRSPELRAAFDAVWPLLDPDAVVRGLWSDPRLLRHCAPWLTGDDVDALTGGGRQEWTDADLPLRDAARLRVGDPRASARRRAARAEAVAERDRMSDVVRDLIASDGSEMHVMSMLRGQDLRGVLDGREPAPIDVLEGPFAHIVVDEAQELSDAEWGMILRRCPSRSLTIVGDRAQARHGFPESWPDRLARVGIRDISVARLGVNYRTPEAIMAAAAPVIRAAVPDANVPLSIRTGGAPVRYGPRSDLEAILHDWRERHSDGTAAVIGDADFAERDRVRSLTPASAKGLEFDLVVLVDPHRFGDDLSGAVDRYVAMTRATQELVILGS